MKVYSSQLALVGDTPIVQLNNIKKLLNLKSNIFAKLEGYNPAGSAKDRIALRIIEDMENKGVLNENSVIVEPTSGNTGIGIALVCAVKGYKAIIVMPDSMSKERVQAISAYGASVVLTKGELGMQGAIDKAEELAEQENTYILGQFENPSNPMAHYETTGKEIYNDMEGNIDYIVAGIGTGGTISGVGKYLKEKKKDIVVVGCEPEASPLLTKGYAANHKIQGIGANFIPKNLDKDVVDKVITVSDDNAYYFTKILAHKEGILAGISSGCALKAAIDIAKEEENKNIVVILPDLGDRYYSTSVFE